jgi:hypothetical protein
LRKKIKKIAVTLSEVRFTLIFAFLNPEKETLNYGEDNRREKTGKHSGNGT